jgi:hypothetical protein
MLVSNNPYVIDLFAEASGLCPGRSSPKTFVVRAMLG